jgi:hypothetical protein
MSASSSSSRLSPKIALDIWGLRNWKKKCSIMINPLKAHRISFLLPFFRIHQTEIGLLPSEKRTSQPRPQIPNYITCLSALFLICANKNNRKTRKLPRSESSTHKTREILRGGEKVYRENSIKLLDENCHNKFSPIN